MQSIDMSIGEAHIAREALFKTFSLKSSYLIHLAQDNKFEYPNIVGYKPLVQFLEHQHQAPVIITNGAKQALGAVFSALNKLGYNSLGMRSPYWSAIPPLANAHNLKCVFNDEYDCYLSILPNNPDNYMIDFEQALHLAEYHKDLDIPFIHDAAYYFPTYIPQRYDYGPFGDVQIYSISKTFGLSGIRIGYVVCNNDSYYNLVKEYMDIMTVGVSIASQDICYNLLKDVYGDKKKFDAFIQEARNKLYINKALCKTINRNVIEVPEDIEKTVGMFLWCRARDCFDALNIRVSRGEAFGDKDKYRINLSVPQDQMIEFVSRLNGL